MPSSRAPAGPPDVRHLRGRRHRRASARPRAGDPDDRPAAATGARTAAATTATTRAALGHTRLAIIDTAGGAQPMCNEDGTALGHLQRRDLQLRRARRRAAPARPPLPHARATPRSSCTPGRSGARTASTASTASGRSRSGTAASSAWSSRRDRLGVRPLFYTPRRRTGSLFASEVKALFADPAVPRELDPVGLDQVLTFWSTVAPRTVFRGVEQLAARATSPCSTATASARTALLEHRLPGARAPSPARTSTRTPHELRERLVEAARLRFLRSDVPVGAYLSGGIDSSITAAVIAAVHRRPAAHLLAALRRRGVRRGRATSSRWSPSSAREHQDIVVVARRHRRRVPRGRAATPRRRCCAPRPAPLFLLSRLVREHGYKVVVTGEGADEVLAGYDIFREGRVRQFWARDPGSAKPRPRRRAALPVDGAARPGRRRRSPGASSASNLDPDDPALSHRPRWDSTGAVKRMLTPTLRDAIGRATRRRRCWRACPPRARTWDPLSRAQWLEMTTLLPGYILASRATGC